MEHVSNEIGPISRLLTHKQVTGNLGPVGTSCKGNKEGRLSVVANNSYGILKELLHKAVPT